MLLPDTESRINHSHWPIAKKWAQSFVEYSAMFLLFWQNTQGTISQLLYPLQLCMPVISTRATRASFSRLALADVRRVCKRRYMMRQTGLELFLKTTTGATSTGPNSALASSAGVAASAAPASSSAASAASSSASSSSVGATSTTTFQDRSFQFLDSRYPSVFLRYGRVSVGVNCSNRPTANQGYNNPFPRTKINK
jgi:hypothetical protein